MRHLLMIVAATVLVGAIGCASEAEQKHEQFVDDNSMWGSQQQKPDCVLGIAPPLTDTAPNKPLTPAAPVVQVSGKSNQ